MSSNPPGLQPRPGLFVHYLILKSQRDLLELSVEMCPLLSPPYCRRHPAAGLAGTSGRSPGWGAKPWRFCHGRNDQNQLGINHTKQD